MRNTRVAIQFFYQALDVCANLLGLLTIDKHAVYPPVFDVIHRKGVPLRDVHSSVTQVINNMVEWDHQCVKR